MGPDEYLILGEPGRQAELEAALSGRCRRGGCLGPANVVRLTGSLAADVLAHGCSIDLHPAAARPGSGPQTLLARTGIILLIRENDEFTVLVRQSFADYFAAWLVDAAGEYLTEEVRWHGISR